MEQRGGHCCCPGPGGTACRPGGTAWRPGMGLGGGMTARGWLAPAAARAARPAAARASSASLWKKTKNWNKKQKKLLSYTQCCGSEMFSPDPWFLPIQDPGSQISDPGSKNRNKRERWKKLVVKKALFFSFLVLTGKNLVQFLKNYRTFYQKNCQIALKNMVLGSGIRDPGSGMGKNQGSGLNIPDPQQWV